MIERFLENNQVRFAIKPQIVTDGVIGVTSAFWSILHYDRIIAIAIFGNITVGNTVTLTLIESQDSAGNITNDLATDTFTATTGDVAGCIVIEKRCEEFTNGYAWAGIRITDNNPQSKGHIYTGLLLRTEPDHKPVTQPDIEYGA